MQGTGRRLANRYSLLELIGQGPATRVWKARDEITGRDLAVKEFVFPPFLDDVEQTVRAKTLLREGRDAARFHDPGAVEVHEVFEEEGTAFVVMEPFAGPTLTEVVADRGTLTPAVAADLGSQLMETLAAAHAAGVLHRGIRPANVVLVDDSTAQLTDFATAAVLPDGESGPSPFCAPEQTSTTGATPAADLWSLGATLYFAVEGRSPPPPGLESTPEAAHDTQGVLGPVLARLLEPDPGARPDDAEASRMLRDAAGLEPTAATGVAPESGDEDDDGAAHAPMVREPWFFPVPVEQVPGSVLTTLEAADPGDPVPPPWRPQSRFHGAPWLTALAVTMSIFLLVVLATQGSRLLGFGSKETPAVPADWVSYTDSSGYAISRPDGWKVTSTGNLTEFSNPETGAFLRIDSEPPSSSAPRDMWFSEEKRIEADGEADYRRVRMVSSRFHGYPAAIWDYAYVADGEEMRAVRLGVATPRQQLTLQFETKAGDWERYQRTLSAFESSFRGF